VRTASVSEGTKPIVPHAQVDEPSRQPSPKHGHNNSAFVSTESKSVNIIHCQTAADFAKKKDTQHYLGENLQGPAGTLAARLATVVPELERLTNIITKKDEEIFALKKRLLEKEKQHAAQMQQLQGGTCEGFPSKMSKSRSHNTSTIENDPSHSEALKMTNEKLQQENSRLNMLVSMYEDELQCRNQPGDPSAAKRSTSSVSSKPRKSMYRTTGAIISSQNNEGLSPLSESKQQNTKILLPQASVGKAS
jgi:hypothetical protein